MIELLSFLAALIPTLFYIGVIYWADRYEKEPLWLLSATFLWGAVPSIVLAVVLNEVFSAPVAALVGDSYGELAGATIVAPLVEETLKGLALLGIFYLRRRDIDSLLDGAIYGAMVGLGFALIENYFYFISEYEAGGLGAWGINIFFRAFVFGLNHALFSSCFGLGLAAASLARSSFTRLVAPAIGWLLAVLTHAAHNTLVSLNSALCLLAPVVDWGGVLLVAAIVLWALRQEQRWMTEYLKEEVQLGTLTFQQYELVRSLTAQSAAQWDNLTHGRLLRYRRTRRFFDQSAKLASLKHHADLHPEDRREAYIQALRADVARRARQLFPTAAAGEAI